MKFLLLYYQGRLVLYLSSHGQLTGISGREVRYLEEMAILFSLRTRLASVLSIEFSNF